MKGLFSLDQELRAARRLNGQKNEDRPVRQTGAKESERPWQQDIDLMHQTMREVLRAVATLSGVELPGLPPGLEDDDVPTPRLGVENLKDRFRNDIEGFSIRTTEELTKKAREKTQAALGAVENEVGGRIDQAAAQLREKMQNESQFDKLLEPAVEKAVSRLEKSLYQKVENLFAEHEKLVQNRLQGMVSSVQSQISTLEQTMQQIRELKAESLAKAPAVQPAAVPAVQPTNVPAVQPVQVVDNAPKKSESNPSDKLKGFLDQAFSRIERSFADIQAIPRPSPELTPAVGLGEPPQSIPFADLDRETRIQKALDDLDRLGTKDSHPAS
jgi:hypothetical protein